MTTTTGQNLRESLLDKKEEIGKFVSRGTIVSKLLSVLAELPKDDNLTKDLYKNTPFLNLCHSCNDTRVAIACHSVGTFPSGLREPEDYYRKGVEKMKEKGLNVVVKLSSSKLYYEFFVYLI